MSRATKLGSTDAVTPTVSAHFPSTACRGSRQGFVARGTAAPGPYAADQGRGRRTPKDLARLPCYSHEIGTAPIFPGTGQVGPHGKILGRIAGPGCCRLRVPLGDLR